MPQPRSVSALWRSAAPSERASVERASHEWCARREWLTVRELPESVAKLIIGAGRRLVLIRPCRATHSWRSDACRRHRDRDDGRRATPYRRTAITAPSGRCLDRLTESVRVHSPLTKPSRSEGRYSCHRISALQDALLRTSTEVSPLSFLPPASAAGPTRIALRHWSASRVAMR